MAASGINRRAAEKIAQWRSDPVLFVREVFGTEPDFWQVDFLLAYNKNERVGAKAAKGCGKTAVLAWCAWHFLLTRPYAKIVATSITGDNLKDGLWSEMAKWMNKSELLKAAFTWTATRIYANDSPETWFMSARTWPRNANAEQQADTLAGLHADYILFILDEVGGIPDSVMATAEAALASGIECKLLICGNPTHLTGPLYRACTSAASLWKIIEITGDPDDPKRSARIKIEWAREQIKQHGRDHPWVMVNVLGKFPPASLNALLGPDEMEAAFNRILPVTAYDFAAKILGVDVARQGGDRTVIFPRQGLVAFKPKVMRIPNLMDIAAVVAQAITTWRPDAVFVDATGGWGWGVIDKLQSLGHAVIPVEYSGKSSNARYTNKRTEMSFEAAEWVKRGGCLPRVEEMKEEATALQYFFKNDKMALIEKDQIRAEIGASPDLWDAFAQTFAFPVAPPDPLAKYRNKPDVDPARGEYDPLERENRVQSVLAEYDPLA